MKALEILTKIIEFYQDPNHLPGIDYETGACQYYFDDNTRCAVGCLLDPKDAMLLENKGLGDFPSICDYYRLDESRHYLEANFTAEYCRLRDQILNLLPEDMDLTTGVYFITSLQTAHDSAAAYTQNKEEFLETFLKDVETFIKVTYPEQLKGN